MTRLPLLIVILAAGASAEPAFEVASVKVNTTPGPDSVNVSPGTLTMHNMSLRRCIVWAWEAPRRQLSGPDWMSDVHLDISAKAAGDVPVSDLRLILRTLLAERMGVRIHEEKREMSVYFLTVAKNGPRLHTATAKDQSQFSESIGDGESHFGGDRAIMVANHVSMSDIAQELSDPLQTPVVDRTGLKGRYDIRLDPTAYMVPAEGGGQGTHIDATSVILTAIPQQLGLKVESGKDIVTVWVVDTASKTPAEN